MRSNEPKEDEPPKDGEDNVMPQEATEGFNHGLRTILWRAFRMTNFHHFRARVLHAFGIPKPQ
jgi:hypothetical protein